MKSNFLEIKELNKKFGPINALKNVTLNINKPVAFKHFQEEFISHNLF